ncbi:hypothetical protein ABPG77_008315 [Micractinium sp. CCAP 211/92]
MPSFGFRLPLSGGGSPFGGRPRDQHRSQRRRLRSASDAAAGSPAQQQGLLSNPVLKSGLISGSLSLAGDTVAQLITSRGSGQGSEAGYDVARAARMGSFGLLFYGPYQFFWYRALDRAFPGRALANFLAKVSLNQLALAPVTITVVFAWNMALTGQLHKLRAKYESDFFPTMRNGWKFWIPAASINFFFMPLQFQVGPCNACAPCLQLHARSLVQGRSTLRLPGARRTQGSARPSGTMRRLHTLPPPDPTMTPRQVLYMSTCGMLWTAYLSYSSARKQ